jgi:hypothetical protein
MTFATCNRFFLIAARLKRLRLMAQLYVGKRPISKGIERVIRRFVVFILRQIMAIEQAVRRYPNGVSTQKILRILPAASPSAHAPNRLS